MVAFENINIGVQVEAIRKNGDISDAKVMWKGALVNRNGLWVGLELDRSTGSHDGRSGGRRYFQCKARHGLFIQANCIRFPMKQRRSYDGYRTKSRGSFVEEGLFNGKMSQIGRDEREAQMVDRDEQAPNPLESSFTKDIRREFSEDKRCASADATHHRHGRSFHLSTGGDLSPSKWDRPQFGLSYSDARRPDVYTSCAPTTSKHSLRFTDFVQGSHVSRRVDTREFFQSPPSIPVHSFSEISTHCEEQVENGSLRRSLTAGISSR